MAVGAPRGADGTHLVGRGRDALHAYPFIAATIDFILVISLFWASMMVWAKTLASGLAPLAKWDLAIATAPSGA